MMTQRLYFLPLCFHIAHAHIASRRRVMENYSDMIVGSPEIRLTLGLVQSKVRVVRTDLSLVPFCCLPLTPTRRCCRRDTLVWRWRRAAARRWSPMSLRKRTEGMPL